MFAVLAFSAKEYKSKVAVLLQGHGYTLRSRFEQNVSMYMAVYMYLQNRFSTGKIIFFLLLPKKFL
jgi:hypothetical protein